VTAVIDDRSVMAERPRPLDTSFVPVRSTWGRWVFLGTLATFVALIVASYAVPLWYQIQGDRLLAVTSGSMAPEIQTGDAVVIRQVTSASQLRLGQIITFYPTGSSKLVTHRIVALANLVREDAAGKPILDAQGEPVRDPYVRTKGDANRVDDPNLTPATSVRGIVREVHTGWGIPLSWAHSPTGRLALFVPPLLLLAFAELRSRDTEPLRILLRRLADAARPVPLDDEDDQPLSGGADAPSVA
jgi:signal peptidase